MPLRLIQTAALAIGLAAAPVLSMTPESPDPSASLDPKSYDGPLFPALGDGGWGYISKDGRFVIPPQFVGAQTFAEDLAAVYVGGGIDFGSKNAGLDRIGKEYRNGLWGFINRHGEFVVAPQFVGAQAFSEGLAAVAYGSEDEKHWGFIDRTGNFVIKPRFRLPRPFENNIAAVLADKLDLVYINNKGKQLSRKEYQIRKFGTALDTYYEQRNGTAKYGLRIIEGPKLTPAKYDDLWLFQVRSRSQEPPLPISILAIAGIGGTAKRAETPFTRPFGCQFGILDHAGKVVVPFDYTSLHPVGEGLAAFTIGGDNSDKECAKGGIPPEGTKTGLLRLADATIAVPPQFDSIGSLSEGLAIAKQGNDRGWIDTAGKWVIPPTLVISEPPWDVNPHLSSFGTFINGLAYVAGAT